MRNAFVRSASKEPFEPEPNMLKISILKVESPGCLWGRVVEGPAGYAQSTGQFDHMMAQMNLFYSDVTQDQHKLRLTSFEQGQICVVYWPAVKSWCRAKMKAVITDSVSSQAQCFLVDYGEERVVPIDQIRVAMPDFLLLPFWVRRFHLSGIKPTRLQVSINDEKAKMIPSSHWDSSATLFLHNLLQGSTQTEAVLYETEDNSTSIQLFLMFGTIKICVNDELVAKKFAYYSKAPAAASGLDEEDQKPVMLSSSFLNQAVNQTKPVPQFAPQSPPSTATCTMGPVETCNLPTSACAPETVNDRSNVEEDCCPDVTETEPLLNNQSDTRSMACAAERFSDCTEETDASLAAALTKNLSLFKFLKFLNPQSTFNEASSFFNRVNKPENPEDMSTATENCTLEPILANDEDLSVRGNDDCLLELSLNNEPKSSGTSSLSGSETVEKERSWRSEEHWACSRLLEWLNPDPLNPDVEIEEAEVPPALNPEKDLHLVHSVFPLQPCHSLDNAPITDQLRRLIQRKQLYSMCPADRYSWPAVVRGCNTLVVSPNADQPISYLPPLLTHVLLNSLFSLTSSTGPVVVVVCPGWEKAQAVFDFMEETKVSHILHPMIIHVGVKEDEAKTIKIPKNCMIVVSTPFSLVRVFSHHCFLFLRMYHLVLDEVDQLFTLAPEQMTNILQHFQKVVSSEDKRSCPQQIVAVSKRWTSQMEGLITSHMPHPSIIITVPEEAALYANIQQAVSNKSAFCMKSHEGLTHEFDFVVQQWRKSIDPGTHVILVTTNECLRCLGIHDASCIIHYGFPSSPRNFGSRLFSMVKNFRNLTEPGSQDKTDTGRCLSRSVLIISERNARHVVGVLRYLGRTSAPLPPELLSFAQSVNVAREDQKTNRPLCSYLKSFGTCRDSSMCADRHCWNPHLDESELPTSGVLEVVPLLIKTASLFYGRIVTKEENNFESILAEITAFYTDKKQGATEVIEGALYAVQDDDVFHRVKVLSIPDRRDRLFFSVFVEFIDIGKREEVKAHQLLQLPEQFQSVPGQAVEIIVCRVKPSDSEKDWHPKVTRAISQKVKGLKHRARVVLSLGNTIFVDPMVRVSHVPGMKTVINEYNLQFEILNSGMAESNPEHINLLKALCETNMSSNKLSLYANDVTSLENRIQAEEEVLAKAFGTGQFKNYMAAGEPVQMLCPLSVITKPVVPCPPTPPPSSLPVSLTPEKLLNHAETTELKMADLSSTINSGTQCMSSQDGSLQINPVVQNGKEKYESDEQYLVV
ncbi:putative ATP-dependent RNA helicase TDRD12 isoform X2 [Boleophthalmus pectinirostris]|uniref:putative ATP-dependent RNA helicase TDRD12 isoform X2 n=1 Tax=Boleophthalmus pectinirostris TaxID=150288 RepID=UPI002431406A|nr:putative ATP-dependent RNA helicase TDRD12 isoform X2 [Boleophthalmus pectinirostris]